ncbi:MAG: MHS family MFS transporter [Actinomycetota bacterium]|nr:MHS family MFS transporter [Actinomycetota bacterium]
MGSAIEWYDFFLYGTAAALIFNRLYFPEYSDTAGTLLAFATFGVGFFARPLGAAVCGHFGDRVGRKAMLVMTLLVMGLSTALIGVLPTYSSIGLAAPLILVLLRVAQGFAVGGEWGGAALMAVEHADEQRRGFLGSFPQLGVPIGLMLSTGVLALVSQLPADRFDAWGWRVPFLASLLLVAVGMFIRLKIEESPEFTEAQSRGEVVKAPLVQVIREYPREVMISAGIRFADNVLYYIFATFALAYLTTEVGVSRTLALTAVLIASAAELVLMPFFGALSDRFGRRPVVLFGAAAGALFAYPYFWLVDTGQPVLICIATLLTVGLAHAAVFAPLAAMFSEMFGTGVRYSGVSVGFQLGALLAGAPTPFIATALLAGSNGEPWWIAAMVVAACCVTIAAALATRESFKSALRTET